MHGATLGAAWFRVTAPNNLLIHLNVQPADIDLSDIKAIDAPIQRLIHKPKVVGISSKRTEVHCVVTEPANLQPGSAQG